MIASTLEWLLKRLLRRDVRVREEVSGAVLLVYLLEQGMSLLRGCVAQLLAFPCTWRPLLMGRRSSVVGLRNVVRQGLLRLGRDTRVVCWSRGGISFGSEVSIGANSYLTNGFNAFSPVGRVRFGNRVGIGEYFYLCCPSSVEIGDDTIVGQFLSIHPQNHIIHRHDLPIRLQGVGSKGVSIGSNCWIGSKVTILDGVTLGAGCVVAAGAVVNKSFPDNSIIAGVPARLIGAR